MPRAAIEFVGIGGIRAGSRPRRSERVNDPAARGFTRLRRGAGVRSRRGGGSNALPKLVRRKEGDFSVIASGSAFSMTPGEELRCVITDSGGAQTLTAFVNGTSRLTSTAIDDDWSAGGVGLVVLSGSAAQLDFDDFKVGDDNNADGDIADAGDDVQISGDLASTTFSLGYDDNGNLTDDGIVKFTYDA